MIPRQGLVKTVEFGPKISTRLKILKIGTFYCFQVQNGQKLEFLAKNLNMA